MEEAAIYTDSRGDVPIDEYQINRIKDQRRLKQQGVDDEEVRFTVEGLTGDVTDGQDRYKDKRDQYSANEEESDVEEYHDGVIGIEPFNMKQELKDGSFDAEGNYVERNRQMTSTNRALNSDETDDPDPWIESLADQAMLASKGDSSSFYGRVQTKNPVKRPSVFQLLDGVPTIDVIKRLISLLDTGETPVDAIRVAEKSSAKKASLPGILNRQKPMATKGVADPTCLEDLSISELTHVLTVTWQNVYYMTREEIVAALAQARNKKHGEASVAPKKYEYKWLNGDEKVYGPSTDVQLLRWIASDFISDRNPILLRRVNSDGTPMSEEWLHYKQTDVYTFLNSGMNNRKERIQSVENISNDPSDSKDEDDVEDTFAKRQRKSELIGINKKHRRQEDSPASDDDPDVV